jgi:hypothetical protein
MTKRTWNWEFGGGWGGGFFGEDSEALKYQIYDGK